MISRPSIVWSWEERWAQDMALASLVAFPGHTRHRQIHFIIPRSHLIPRSQPPPAAALGS